MAAGADEVVLAVCGLHPAVERRTIVLTMAGDHGVAAKGVSQYPAEVAGQMVRNFAVGGAGIKPLARVGQARLLLIDMGVAADIGDLVDSGAVLGRSQGRGTHSMAQGRR